jgi:hypothetical protein
MNRTAQPMDLMSRVQGFMAFFLQNHSDMEPVLRDYSNPEGLLYRMIQQGETGLLPMIAMIT